MNELELQPKLHYYLSDPSKVWKTANGKRLQVLSPGNISNSGGADFINIAILLDGLIYIGDAEFDLDAKNWYLHGHNDNPEFNKVILHIICGGEPITNLNTLQIDLNELKDFELPEIENKISDYEELQHFALIRLIRKSAESQKAINELGIEKGFAKVVTDFIERYNGRKRRPIYSALQLSELAGKVSRSDSYKFLVKVMNHLDFPMHDDLFELLKMQIMNEGIALRREIILNCTLPTAICLANDRNRIALFMWYWGTPALSKYGILEKRFPEQKQNYLWQQQGMLEYIKEAGRRRNLVAEAISEYGLTELLKFYKIGRSHIELSENEYEEGD